MGEGRRAEQRTFPCIDLYFKKIKNLELELSLGLPLLPPVPQVSDVPSERGQSPRHFLLFLASYSALYFGLFMWVNPLLY